MNGTTSQKRALLPIDVNLLRALACLLLAAVPAVAQPKNPVKWTLTPDVAKLAPGSHVALRLDGVIEPGWHVYSMTTPKGGAPQTRIAVAENSVVKFVHFFQRKPEVKLDPNFGVNTENYESKVGFVIEAEIAKDAPAGPFELTANLRFSVCSDKECLPLKRTVATNLEIDASAPLATMATLTSEFLLVDSSKPAAPVAASSFKTADQALGPFLLLAFGLGLAALFTPCVFPMIPFTVSAFLDQPAGGWKKALVFCLGIVVMFTALGFGLTVALGPFGVVQLGSNVWVNGFISIVFLVFGLSLLGAFELTLPYGLVNKLNAASGQGGYAGALLMGFTFTLTSFACVGPFMGTLLAASVQGDRLQPVLGMATFAAGLALPFFLLALFPAYLQKLPRSGGWLMRVKVVMGFIVLAFLLKYVSNIDSVMQWGLLPRERFLAFWVVLFAMPGAYLLGWLPLEGTDRNEALSVPRLVIGSLFLVFALSLVPGMSGVALGELDAMVPSSTHSLSGGGADGALVFIKNDYPAALAKAKAENKLLFVDFTGYACSNCKWMKANMFPKPEIQAALAKLVIAELYTDGTDAVSEQNQKLQESRFQTVALPFYALIDGDEKTVATFSGVTRDPAEFLKFLETASR